MMVLGHFHSFMSSSSWLRLAAQELWRQFRLFVYLHFISIPTGSSWVLAVRLSFIVKLPRLKRDKLNFYCAARKALLRCNERSLRFIIIFEI